MACGDCIASCVRSGFTVMSSGFLQHPWDFSLHRQNRGKIGPFLIKSNGFFGQNRAIFEVMLFNLQAMQDFRCKNSNI